MTKKRVSFIWFFTLRVSKGVYELFLANSCITCFFPSIRLFTKMLQFPEFVTSHFCGCCIIRDFVLINRNVSTGNVDTSNAAYRLLFYLFN